MFYIIYDRATKHISECRNDMSTGAPTDTTVWLEQFAKNHGCNAADYRLVEIPYREFQLIIGKHIYNPSSQQIEQDPNWVAPPPPPSPPPGSELASRVIPAAV
jgi:hypothetical protein